MNAPRISIFCLAAVIVCVVGGARPSAGQETFEGSNQDRLALAKTADAIRAAFAAGNVDEVMAYHHPKVEKWLSPTKHLVGRDAVRADLAQVFQSARIEFTSNEVESVLFAGQSAVEVTNFTLRGTPKNGGASFVFKGHSMVVYVRSSESPTGWASIRELIQPAP